MLKFVSFHVTWVDLFGLSQIHYLLWRLLHLLLLYSYLSVRCLHIAHTCCKSVVMELCGCCTWCQVECTKFQIAIKYRINLVAELLLYCYDCFRLINQKLVFFLLYFCWRHAKNFIFCWAISFRYNTRFLLQKVEFLT